MRVIALIGAGAVLFGASVWAADDNAESYIRKSFEVSAGGKLTIQADRGSINVKSGPGDRVQIEVTREPGRGQNEEVLKRHHISFTQDGKDVMVRAEMEDEKRFWKNNNLKVRYEVVVPSKYDVNLKTSGGSVTVHDLDGEARAETSGGGLNLGQIKGPVFARTSGGSIHVEGAGRDVDARTSGGGITIDDAMGNIVAHTSGGSIHVGQTKGSVTVETSGGGIELKGAAGPVSARTSGGSIRAAITSQPNGDCLLTTSGGGIELKMPATLAFDVDARTSGGSVSTEIPVMMEGDIKKNLLRSKLNGGGPKLTMHTSGGSIHLRKL
jgi:DUF4097 and DUF4098 domain-containing protein YvlB